MVLDKDMLISRRIDNMFNIDYIKAIISKFLRTSNKNVKIIWEKRTLLNMNIYYVLEIVMAMMIV